MFEKKPDECGYATCCYGVPICSAKQIPCQRVKSCPKDPHRMDGIIAAMKKLRGEIENELNQQRAAD